MTQGTTGAEVTQQSRDPFQRGRVFTYDRWMESVGIPIHRGYFIEDLRTVQLGWWEERGCNAAFIQLAGMEGVNETRVTEIGPGETLPPWRLAVDEIVYVLEGRGLTTVWKGDGASKKTFEWQKHSLFLLPRGYHHQISSAQGDRPVRLMQYNALPIAMSAIPDPEFFFNNPYELQRRADGQEADLYAEAKSVKVGDDANWNPYVWHGNFFPDMHAWDKLNALKARGAGGTSVQIQFTNSEMRCHMSVFSPQLYKKAHRHGPGRAIVIPVGEGYSILWPEGREKVIAPWHEGSLFTPPNKWFHQHFNLGGIPARYLALAPLAQFSGHAERVEDRARDQIEYPDEEPWIRQKFEEELAKRGLTSLMAEDAYRDRDYQWAYDKE